ncbi:hypothetical protein Tco_1178788, partial [Tanacetum coccineum]
WEYWLRLSEYADTLLSLLPNLLNTLPSFFLAFCLGDLDRSRLILENTLGLGCGLRVLLDLCLLSYSLVLVVLDLEYRDVLEHPPKLSRAFTSFSFSFLSFSLLNFSAMIGSSEPNTRFSSISLGLFNGSKWAPCLARVRCNHDFWTWNPFRGCGIPSAEGLRRPLMASYAHFATSRPCQHGTRLS